MGDAVPGCGQELHVQRRSISKRIKVGHYWSYLGRRRLGVLHMLKIWLEAYLIMIGKGRGIFKYPVRNIKLNIWQSNIKLERSIRGLLRCHSCAHSRMKNDLDFQVGDIQRARDYQLPHHTYGWMKLFPTSPSSNYITNYGQYTWLSTFKCSSQCTSLIPSLSPLPDGDLQLIILNTDHRNQSPGHPKHSWWLQQSKKSKTSTGKRRTHNITKVWQIPRIIGFVLILFLVSWGLDSSIPVLRGCSFMDLHLEAKRDRVYYHFTVELVDEEFSFT